MKQERMNVCAPMITEMGRYRLFPIISKILHMAVLQIIPSAPTYILTDFMLPGDSFSCTIYRTSGLADMYQALYASVLRWSYRRYSQWAIKSSLFVVQPEGADRMPAMKAG